MRIQGASLLLLAALGANAQILVEETSFGYNARAPDTTNLPGWKLLGEGQDIQLLSDKVILTPPYPGNKRGALWTEHTTALNEWTADFYFRANGPERAGGNLQLWYANNGEQKIGTSSIYTVGKFDGLAIVIDSHAEGRGSIRGFLNDGTSDYQARHPAIDSLAFGHCEYNYRNLGRPSRLQVKHSQSGLEVRIDERTCFSSSVITLPPNNNFGITAATSENPDSFEVFKFVVTSGSSQISQSQPPPPQQQQQQFQQPPPPQQQQQQYQAPPPSPELSAQLSSLTQLLNSLAADFATTRSLHETRHQELLRRIPQDTTISGLTQRLQALESTVSGLKREIESADHAGQFTKLRDQLSQTHNVFTEGLPQTFREGKSSSP